MNEFSMGFWVYRAGGPAHRQADCSVLGMVSTVPVTTWTVDLGLEPLPGHFLKANGAL